MRKLNLLMVLLVLTLAQTACQSVYYDAMEKVGYHKRDIMTDRVEAARDAQAESKEEFQSALEAFQSLFGKEDSDLQKQYDILNEAYEDANSSAEAVSSRIEKVVDVSEALFEEWEEEIKLYSSDRLRQDSRAKLRDTRTRYEAMLKAMRQAESRMTPVLAVFRDQVLYLKHNLNARAISGLQGELKGVEKDVDRLIRDMEASIGEAQAFIDRLNGG